MPVDLDDVDTSGTELWFADKLEGETFLLRESAVYDAEEVRDETGTDTPEFGRWFPVVEATEDGEDAGQEGWAVALGELIEELQQAQEDSTTISWTVTRCEKSGTGQTDPYEVNVVFHGGTEPKQAGLDKS